MKRNLTKKINNMYVPFGCAICLDIFEAKEYVYETTYGDGLACYDCAKESENMIVKRIDKKIACLNRSKEIILK